MAAELQHLDVESNQAVPSRDARERRHIWFLQGAGLAGLMLMVVLALSHHPGDHDEKPSGHSLAFSPGTAPGVRPATSSKWAHGPLMVMDETIMQNAFAGTLKEEGEKNGFMSPQPARREMVGRFMGAAALFLSPKIAPALEVPTFSLKGAPGLGGVFDEKIEKPLTAQLGVIGRGKDKTKSGLLNPCDKKGCMTSFAQGDAENYIPPMTYQPGYSTSSASSYDSPLKKQLREENAKKDRKSLDTAFTELLEAVKAFPGATIIKAEAEDRYIYAEIKEGGPLGDSIDDVEFLLSTDSPIVGYRSSPRAGNDDQRQRRHIRDIRKSLAPQNWKSVGRIVE